MATYPMILKLALLLALTLTACQALPDLPPTGDSADAPPATSLTAPAQDGQIAYENGGITLRVKVPDGWQCYNTANGIVLTEHIGTAATAGHLQGILVYIFMPPMDGFELPTARGVNVAWAVLRQVISNPDYVGRALVSEPQAFDWDRHDAAYYLLNNRDGTLTLLLAMSLAPGRLMVVHISVPESHGGRVRPLLPDLLQSLTVNDVPISADALRHLPDPLLFPTDKTHPG